MRRDNEQFRQAKAQIVLIGMGSPEHAHTFRENLALDFMILSDPKKQAYRAYGLTLQMNLAREITNVHSGFRFIRDSLRHGMAKPASEQDLMQLGGTFIADPDGIIRFAYASLRASDTPTTANLLLAIAAPRGI